MRERMRERGERHPLDLIDELTQILNDRELPPGGIQACNTTLLNLINMLLGTAAESSNSHNSASSAAAFAYPQPTMLGSKLSGSFASRSIEEGESFSSSGKEQESDSSPEHGRRSDGSTSTDERASSSGTDSGAEQSRATRSTSTGEEAGNDSEGSDNVPLVRLAASDGSGTTDTSEDAGSDDEEAPLATTHAQYPMQQGAASSDEDSSVGSVSEDDSDTER
jgi:hypothetical protein